jgi:SAM-dependent methyltransferase
VTRWPQGGGAAYAARFAALAESGRDLHGEARFCSALVPPGSRVLDAGCGTGRVAIELARRGYVCVGTDLDPTMLAEAERAAPELRWVRADLAALDLTAPDLTAPDLGDEPLFDLVVCAGNVVPLVTPGTEAEVLRAMADHLSAGGLLVTGFGLDRVHLPRSAALIDLGEFDGWCSAAGLAPVARYSTWEGDPWPGDGGYAVSVFRRS